MQKLKDELSDRMNQLENQYAQLRRLEGDMEKMRRLLTIFKAMEEQDELLRNFGPLFEELEALEKGPNYT
ncbi:hypothetical protein COLO4_15069 [Corchorus olitorius]|uniref:Uncharacterized protein n=1 Tax=Corchorus olitorius TaxID=93759 RepID=A0A1R3JQ35_9ROSI|nr:hypothetical protein COLO4_15069 [Corchorus olitorius]